MTTKDTALPVPFVDLGAIHGPIHDRVMAAIEELVRSQRFILGETVTHFETELAAFCQTAHAVGCSSGTDALLMALMALDIGPGDEVITTAFTFAATAMAIVRVGARPVFVDIDASSFNLDPRAVEDAITPSTRAIMPVHLFGRACDMDALQNIANRHELHIIEDAAQAIGATWNGRAVGSIGAVGCFSFFPAKNLGAFGDGGAVTTQREELHTRLRTVRVQGASRRYFHDRVGGNFRLDALQAAILRVKLRELATWTETRQRNAFRYQDLFYARALTDSVMLPSPGPGRHVYNQFTLRVLGGRRQAAYEALRAAQVGCAIYYPCPLHLQPAFEAFSRGPNSLPETERASQEVLSIPVAPGLTARQQERVVDVLFEALG